MKIELKHLEILGHSLGINVYHALKSKKKRDKKLPKEFFRNRFCTSDGHGDLPIITTLEKSGYMLPGHKINNGTSTLWYVTEEGENVFRKEFTSLISI